MNRKKNNTKTSILSFFLLSIILVGVLVTSISASTTYQLTLKKGTDEFVVDLYNDTDWKTIVDPSLTPSDWLEGEANITNAKSKVTLKGWTTDTWGTYDVLTSIFIPEYFSLLDIGILLVLLASQYNETTMDEVYTNDYALWYGLRAVWNYTTNEYEEDPSSKDELITLLDPLRYGIIVLQDPLEYKTMLDDYHILAAELNGNLAIQMAGYSFPNISADDFLWQLALSGLAIAGPQSDYLDSLVSELGCENVTVSGSMLIIKRYGVTNYTVEVSYGEKGMMSSFTVKDISANVIYQITSSNSEWLFYLILIIVAVSAVAIVTFLIIRKKKLHR
ncbi:MAG: hypothetical protein HWN80_11665 [Candidatus Lokiarchaeota archaeon]|nr:hypothetical protein [Candidatus Lokiarchaeota archaeon]